MTPEVLLGAWDQAAADEASVPISRDISMEAVMSLGNVAEVAPSVVSASTDFFRGLKATLSSALDPGKTILARTKGRFPPSLRAKLNRSARRRDELDPILVAPVFDQPMYEPLRDLAHELLLPGVEKIPQNTVGILETNRRFVESFLVGCNHEFAGELLWRGYPTDQRGSYFRQFWDVTSYAPKRSEMDTKGNLKTLMREALRDVKELHKWKNAKLGVNTTALFNGMGAAKASLVLVVRGDLLRRYPDTLVYAVEAVEGTDGLVPALAEFGEEQSPLQFPMFRGTLPPDITFFGFPFNDTDARSDAKGGTGNGFFFVIEQRPHELRWALDLRPPGQAAPSSLTESDWAWQDFGLAEAFGKYLDDATTAPSGWTSTTSSAARAKATLQQPVRIAIHADQMLP
jgi:hypothetical protein